MELLIIVNVNGNVLNLLTIVHHLILILEKKAFLVLGESPANGINDNNGAAEKKFSTNFSKAKANLLRFTLQWR